jgi:L,D-transpeptidase ErfK/SrfK
MHLRLFALTALLTLGTATFSFAKTYDKDYVGETKIHRAVFEDTLVHLARNNGLGFVEIRAANPNLDPWIPGAGAKVVIPAQHILPDAPRQGVVINLPEMRLYYFPSNGGAPVSYSIGVGREGLNTPVGATAVNRKVHGPTWTPTPRMRKEKPELPISVKPFDPRKPDGNARALPRLSTDRHSRHG